MTKLSEADSLTIGGPTIGILTDVTDLPSPEHAINTLVSVLAMVILTCADDDEDARELCHAVEYKLHKAVTKNLHQAETLRRCIELIKTDPRNLGKPQ